MCEMNFIPFQTYTLRSHKYEVFMNYLITGGTGLIGQSVIAKLLQRHAFITVLTRDISKAKKHLPRAVKFIESLSLADIDHNDIVINLAGESIADKRWSTAQKDKICASRWSLTQKIVSFIQASQSPPLLFISGSAIGIYGRQRDQPIGEGFSHFNREFTNTLCEKWESIAMQASTESTRVSLLRTGLVLDKHQGALAKMLLPFKLGIGGKIAQGDQIMSWIHIEDMTDAIIHIIHHDDLNGPINMTAENAVTNKVFSSTLAAKLRRPCLFSTPASLLKLIFGEMADLLLFGQNVYPEKLLSSQFTFKHPTIDDALEDLLNTE